jgi:hypothetical protein
MNPWPHYEQAVRCHLDGKKDECEPYYKKAIANGDKTPGLHASYGTHLLQNGKVQEANAEFEIEKRNFPEFAPLAIAKLSAGDVPADTTKQGAQP